VYLDCLSLIVIRMLKTSSKITVDGFFIMFLQTVLIDDVLKSIMLRNEIFLMFG
jgi:hypothetical protein